MRPRSVLSVAILILSLAGSLLLPRPTLSFLTFGTASSTVMLGRASRLHRLAVSSALPSSSSSSLLSSPRIFRSSSSSSSSSSPPSPFSASSSPPSPVPSWPTSKVRQTFIDYFQSVSRGRHTHVPSSPVVPLSDPSLLFANAGMNQFKPIFLGQADPSSPLASLSRAVNSQKCIRAGGKHNDLEDVGLDTYHHTFFEMLGTWSFNSAYFKKEAILYAFDLLTNVYGLDKGNMYATYFQGDAKLGLEPDLEAKELWLQLLPPSRVLGCDAKANFWEMGESGPCGPCSEIHYDRIGGRDASALVNNDDPDVIEIWNIVFIQYNREAQGGKLKLLPHKHIDTGMGLERLASLLQRRSSNYDIDVFQPLFKHIHERSKAGTPPYGGLVGSRTGPGPAGLHSFSAGEKRDTAYRAIADHARCLAFALADGATPSNEHRGYVLRRILRRAVRYGQQVLNTEKGIMASLIPVVVDTFKDAYPELEHRKQHIVSVIEEEERSFDDMLSRGIKYFEDLVRQKRKNGSEVLTGSEAFFLYDTLGFPLDLTELMAAEAGLKVDVKEFEKEMEVQRTRSREDRKRARSEDGAQGPLVLQAAQTAWLNDCGVKPTRDDAKYSRTSDLQGRIMAIYSGAEEVNAGFVNEARHGDRVGVIMDKTSFYAESGGQIFDTGTLVVGGSHIKVIDCQVFGGYVLHVGTVSGSGAIAVGSEARSEVDYSRRGDVAPNHTMTHLLNYALRKVVGADVEQRGSSVAADKLRFDFSCKSAVSPEQLQAVEDIVVKAIKDRLPVFESVVPLAEAKRIGGVRAVFGEMYPDPVRVISVGRTVAELQEAGGFGEGDVSVEFCGGTHLKNTGDAEDFVIVEEAAVAKGIRRVVGVTREAAKACKLAAAKMQGQVSALEKSPLLNVDDLSTAVSAQRKELDSSVISVPVKVHLRARLDALQKKCAEENKKKGSKCLDDCLALVKEAVVGQSMTSQVFRGIDLRGVQKIADAARKANPNCHFFGVVEGGGEGSEKDKLVVFAVVPESGAMVPAEVWLGKVMDKFGGKGGGKGSFAQGFVRCDKPARLVVAAYEEYLITLL